LSADPAFRDVSGSLIGKLTLQVFEILPNEP